MELHWLRFNQHCARQSSRGRLLTANGISVTWAQSMLPVNNVTTPLAPPRDGDDLRAIATAALADAASQGLPWMFCIPEPWHQFEGADQVLNEAGMQYMMKLICMENDGNLAPPVRPLPEDMVIQRIETREQAYDALSLNCLSYGMPPEIADDALAANYWFRDPQRDFGINVYLQSGQIASTATAVDLGDWIYIAAVATHPDHRKKGYAELAMREAMKLAPARPTSLDASAMGQPLYAQMGYQHVYDWTVWVPAGEGHSH